MQKPFGRINTTRELLRTQASEGFKALKKLNQSTERDEYSFNAQLIFIKNYTFSLLATLNFIRYY